jgi:folate-binding protein YgfZ
MMRSPLRPVLATHGARFGLRDDTEIVLDFGDVPAEYRAIRAAAGLLDLSYRRKLSVTGADRTGFLQGMLSNDVRRLGPGQGCLAAFLTVQGRVVATPRVYVRAEDVMLDVEPETAARLKEGLLAHVVADDVEIEDITASIATVAVQGPNADAVLAAATGSPPAFARELDHGLCVVGGHEVTVARVREMGELGFELFVQAAVAGEVWRRVLESAGALGLRPAGGTAAEICRVEAGRPRDGVDMDPSRLLLEVGLDEAISSTKGCYLGQEVVERGTARGQVNRRLVGLRVLDETVPAPGARVEATGREVGVVTSAVRSPALGRPVAMAYVRREHLAPGTRLTVEVPGGTAVAEVCPLPFYGG